MGRLSGTAGASPVQRHSIYLANDVSWIAGELETLGSPHNYINQDGLDYLRVRSAHIIPWSFTGLPASRAEEIVVTRDRVQLLIFPEEASVEDFRAPPRTEPILASLPLAVMRGAAPFLGEAKLHNFLDFWKGGFVPLLDAQIHFLAENGTRMPDRAQLVYFQRSALQHYTGS